MWNMRGGRVFFSLYIYIYIYGVFGNFIFKRVGSGLGMKKSEPDPNLLWVFFKDLYLTLLFIRSGQTEYPCVGVLLPSLFLKGH